MEKILIVDDELDLLEILSYNLEKSGFIVEKATSGEQAVSLLEEKSDYALILLDVMMSGMSGYDMAKKIRKKGNKIPIIFLTALDGENDLLEGFSSGGDDYISKPFSVKEVIARVKAVISRMPQKKSLLEFKNISINLEEKTVFVDDEYVKLTKTEYLLLLTFLSSVGRVFSREDLLSKVWRDDTFVEPRTVDVHIARLRKKLVSAGKLIVNRSGYGYCIEKF